MSVLLLVTRLGLMPWIAKDQGIVEFFQSRSSLWNYVEKAEHDWKAFYEFCYGVAQTFVNAEETDSDSKRIPGQESQSQQDQTLINVDAEVHGFDQP